MLFLGIVTSVRSQSSSIGVVILLALCAGRQVIRGNASKAFQPFLLPEDMKKNLDELKKKLMVGFDPQRYLISEIEASNKVNFLYVD